jgi:hypothetical protein
MTSRKGALNRRTLLRGALQGGAVAAIGVPLLEAMLDSHGEALATGAPLPRRFVTWFFGNGVNLNQFEPNMPGSAGYALSPLLQDLTDVKDYLTVCTGLQNRARITQTHHEGLTAFTGYDYINRPDLPGFASDFGGPTIDQVIADRLEGATPIHSLQFQVTKAFSSQDSGATSQQISAQGAPGSLVFKRGETNPRTIWKSLFGAAPGAGGVRSSMLDFVRQDVTKMRGRLGSADKLRMDAHLQALRELEATIVCAAAPAEPMEENLLQSPAEPITSVNSIMAELLAVCFACDLTRVASVLFLPLAGGVTFGVDVPNTDETTHHVWSHNQSGTGSDGQNAYDQNVRYIMNRFGDWMRALKNHVEPGGTTSLLDSTILFASSDCATGNNHQINRQPILLGGHGRGHLLYPGVHFQAVAGDAALGTLNSMDQPAARNTSDVLLTCLQAFDPAATSVGDLDTTPFPSAVPPGSTTPLSEIEA